MFAGVAAISCEAAGGHSAIAGQKAAVFPIRDGKEIRQFFSSPTDLLSFPLPKDDIELLNVKRPCPGWSIWKLSKLFVGLLLILPLEMLKE